MKYFLMIVMLFSIITPTFAKLDEDDLNQIRLLIAEELKPIKTEIQSVKDELKAEIQSVKDELKAEIQSVKVDVAKVDGRVDGIDNLITWLLAIIICVFGLPQVVALWLNRKDDRELKKQVETLAQEMEILRQQIQTP